MMKYGLRVGYELLEKTELMSLEGDCGSATSSRFKDAGDMEKERQNTRAAIEKALRDMEEKSLADALELQRRLDEDPQYYTKLTGMDAILWSLHDEDNDEYDEEDDEEDAQDSEKERQLSRAKKALRDMREKSFADALELHRRLDEDPQFYTKLTGMDAILWKLVSDEDDYDYDEDDKDDEDDKEDKEDEKKTKKK